MAQQCLFLLLILAVATQVRSQLDSHGFLSIDCGLYNESSYIDSYNNLTYLSDDKFIDTGVNSNISSSIIKQYGDTTIREYLTVRYFPTGSRNCYTLKPLTIGLNYLVRATFYYANYDSLYKPPTFDIYLGANLWDTINDTNSYPEIIFVAKTESVQVCLINKGLGVPFISSLHLRPFNTSMYPHVNTTTSLILRDRLNLGGIVSFIGYPDDPYDRWWWNFTASAWNSISFNNSWNRISFNNSCIVPDTEFQTPISVLRTAVTSSSTKEALNLSWWNEDISTVYYFILHFYDQPTTGRREFDIFVNGVNESNQPLSFNGVGSTVHRWSGYTNYTVSLVATSNSTLPPLLNACELYIISPVAISTHSIDVAAINSIKEHYKIEKGWSGDPCFPKEYTWAGVLCSTDGTDSSKIITRITSLNLSSSHLIGPLNESFGNLTALENLYLSNNSLAGSLPSFLDNLASLKLLDIRGNPNILTTLPPGLNKKQQNGTLEFRFGDISTSFTSPPPATSPPPKKNVTVIAIAVVVPLLVIVIAIATMVWLKRKKSYRSYARHSWEIREGGENFPKLEIHQFCYNDLKKITNNFKNKIGTGGFGSVYFGILEDEVQVAVKIHSNSSGQGVKELFAEAESLSRVHHKNLVSLMGYCIDMDCMALVYEYMPEGNLHDKLKDNENPLCWKQRLQIAYESALGLEYLHKACNPPLVHRDVKTSNILLNANFEAKIADFGLSKSFSNAAITHISTRVVGTPGYLDPEYYLSNGQLTVKSDVFSFGIVVLEIITGRPPITADPDEGNLLQWVREKLSGGNFESIVDTRMQGKYDINSVWKVTNLACKCTELKTSERPTMTEVAAELKESLDLEASMEETRDKNADLVVTDVSQETIDEMVLADGIIVPGPSVR